MHVHSIPACACRTSGVRNISDAVIGSVDQGLNWLNSADQRGKNGGVCHSFSGVTVYTCLLG